MSSTPTQRARASSPNPQKKEPAKEEKKDEKKGGFLTPKNLAILGAVVVVGFVLKTTVLSKIDLKAQMESAVSFIEKQGSTAVAWYCLFTLIGVVCLVPTTPMEIAGGFLFSPMYGLLWVCVWTGATKLVANMISVLIARYVVKDWVVKNFVEKYELLKMVSVAVKEEPWKMAFLVRGSMVPLAVKNYGLGVMDIGFLPIAGCSTIFTNFYACQNIYLGSTMQNLAEVFAPKKAGDGPSDWTATAKKLLPIAFNVMLIVFLVKAVKAQVKKQKAKIEEDLKKKSEKSK
jgi:uncharacterized membrane protein YdjX (TVP38/TMEM64 family)